MAKEPSTLRYKQTLHQMKQNKPRSKKNAIIASAWLSGPYCVGTKNVFNLEQMHMQSLLRKQNEPAQFQNTLIRAFSKITRTPIVTFVNLNVLYSLSKTSSVAKLYGGEVQEVV